MRAVVPILFVVLGLGVAGYANGRMPGGLANADLAAITELARHGAIDLLDRAYPKWRDTRSAQSVRKHLHRHSQHVRQSSQSTTIRTRYRIKEGAKAQLIEIQFVTPRDEVTSDGHQN